LNNQNRSEFKFERKIAQKDKDTVVMSNIWNKYSKNILAEKGMEIKLKINDLKAQSKVDTHVSPKVQNLTKSDSILLPKDLNNEDDEIEFVNPERLIKEQIEKMEKEKDPDAKPKAPIIMISQSENQRTMLMQQLRKKKMRSANFEDVQSLNRITDLNGVKVDAQPEAEGEDRNDTQNEPKSQNLEESKIGDNLQQVDAYLNDDKIDTKKIRELEGDLEDEDDEGDDAGEGDEGDDEEQESEADAEQGQPEPEIEQHKPTKELDPEQRAREIEKLKARIRQRRQASKFLEIEAELGSDHEDNDGMLKQIDNQDFEEILDKKLEFLDADIEGLIDDNENIDQSIDNLAAKFLQDDLLADKQNLVKLITTITSKNRRKRADITQEDLDQPDNIIWNRMRQKQAEFELKEQEIYDNEDVKQRILKA
jgi:hypothetical protein